MARTSVDGLATSPRTGPIASLHEEVWDNPVSPDGKKDQLGSLETTGAPSLRFSDGNGYLPVEYNLVIVALPS